MLATPVAMPIFTPIAQAVQRVLGSAWNPASLFASSTGYIYDLNDLSTVFQDSAGTVAGAINQPVGLVLDKSKGLALGVELFLSLDFRAWTPAADISGQTENSFTSTGFGGVYTSIPGWTATKSYSIRIIGTSTVAFSVRNTDNVSGLVSVPSGPFDITIKSPLLTQSSTSGQLYLQVDSAGTVTVTSLSVKELPGNHRYQTTAASRPILRGTPTGLNLFASYGTPGSGWADSGSGVATATASTASIPTNVVPSASRVYRVRYTATVTSGTVRLTLGGQNGVTRSASGTYEEYIAATSTAALSFQGVSAFTGTVSAIDVRDVSADSVTTPYGLQMDGADDFEQTGNVDLTGTNKVVVCIGVRKSIEQSNGTILEFSAGADANNGAFFLRASGGGGANYQWCVRSSTSFITPAFSTAAPDTSVLTLIADLGAPQTTLRQNGVQGLQTAAPAGGGTFGNYPFYFGRRAGTLLPFNGLEYSSICVGKAVTAAELANIERWVAQRTGVVI